MLDLSDSNTLLAGVSMGLGYAVASDLSRKGSKVMITARNSEKLQRIASATGVKYYACDLTRESELLLDHFHREAGDLNNLVIMIGGFFHDSIQDLTALDIMVDSHVKTTLRFLEKAVKRMKDGSNVVLVSSTQTLSTTGKASLSYSISKYALNKAVEVTASHLLSQQIRVNAVAPSVMMGDFESGRDYRKLRKLGSLETPPEDVANVIAWLLSPDSEWVNGVVIPVDGGHRLK